MRPSAKKASTSYATTTPALCSPEASAFRELADYLDHADPAFTLHVYAHLLPSSHDRARQVINDHFTRMRADADSRTSRGSAATEQKQPDGTETEQRPVPSP
jgi:hypothetical protein